MAQYIDKATLVTEIEKRKKKLETNILLAKKQKDTIASKSMRLYIGCYNSILSLLDTFEVKGEFKKESETECPNFDEAQGTPITK